MWMPGDPITVREMIRRARAELVDSESPLLDVECLLGFVLKCSRAELVLAAHHVPMPDQVQAFEKLFDRRKKGEPIAYLIGEKSFWDFEVEVTEDTLIPRPETETLVILAIEHLQQNLAARVLELGTGSGVIAIALAKTFAKLDIVALDRSLPAVQVAKRNAERLGLTHIQWLCADWFSAMDARFDLIVSNPPYIAEGDDHLDDLSFEPQTALVSGNEGLDDLHHLIFSAPWYLNRPGWLFLEHGSTQGDAVRHAMLDKGFTEVVTHQDLSGNDRVTVGVMAR
jgi:release factor glutamine methyltransferase